MSRKRIPKLFALLIISLFIVSCSAALVSKTQATGQTDTWFAKPLHITPLATYSSPHGYTPDQIKLAYGLPATGGAGATIAIINAYDTPTIWNDLGNFSATYNLPPPTNSNFEVHQMSTSMSTNSNWTEETCLDVEWAHAIAPEAKILLVEAVDERSDHLIQAINYVTSRSDVAAVSMSWGTPEYSREIYDDRYFNSLYPMVFFAASGDNGGSEMLWPASSPFVVSIGGTTLNLNSNGAIISEVTWGGSGGGKSQFEAMPAFQTGFGLTGNRQVPDVAYNANASTGFPVYANSQWYKIGGTSAGAPQWAAIHALGRSANNAYLYSRASTAYSSYFRDITAGSNSNNTATAGYDLVTGLGSPLTYNFAVNITVSPNLGPAQAPLTITGDGLTPNTYANISYLNPLTSKWSLLANNIMIDPTGHFAYPFLAPDLLQSNLAGDNQPGFNNIAFQVKDASTGRSYNSTILYTEMQRGLIQIGSQTATGLYGNNTNLGAMAFVQNGQAITVSGSWFSANQGFISLFLDGATSLGTSPIDANGAFNANVIIPPTTVGQHKVTVSDGSASLCINITRIPAVPNDFVNGWHTSDITVNLANETNITDTYYSINNGPVYNVSANGQPKITTEGNANTLEYWSTWNIGALTKELPHTIIQNIQLQKTPLQASLQINSGATQTNSTIVALTLGATSLSGAYQMRLSNDGIWDSKAWEPFAPTKTWALTNGSGLKTIYCQIQDNAGFIVNTSASIDSISIQPTSAPIPNQSQPTIAPQATIEPIIAATPSETQSVTYKLPETPMAPELSIPTIMLLLAVVASLFAVIHKKKFS